MYTSFLSILSILTISLYTLSWKVTAYLVDLRELLYYNSVVFPNNTGAGCFFLALLIYAC